MPKTKPQDASGGSWVFRDIPRDLMKKAKIAAAIEGKSIKALLIEALEIRLQDLEKKGLLPKGKN
jgi:predicted HicB family RNase H-like nuclease